uniref:Uncharacterized protein n=2 Tax=Meloidogyne TaxID=189290 RepID=A0A915LQC2_MELJA
MFSHFFSLILHELNRNCWLLIPLAYIIYRLTRTFLALLQAFLIYFVAPLFYTPNLDIYVNRWIAVSGGTDGIGKAYIFELAKLGLRKFILIGRSEIKLAAVKEEIESQYQNSCVETILFDFNNAIYPEYADKLRRELSQFNIGFALNSVGVGRELLERFGDRPEADRQLFRVNAFGAGEFISAVLPSMERFGGGQIVVLSSSQGFRPIPLLAAYSATKSFVSFISEAVGEYSTISVQCLTPALVATNMTYYKSGSLLVVTPEKFAKQAIGTLGLVKMTSGCFNHEIQLLIRHLFPWKMDALVAYGSDSENSDYGGDELRQRRRSKSGGKDNEVKQKEIDTRMDDSDDDGSKAPRQHATADIDSSDTEFDGPAREDGEDSEDENEDIMEQEEEGNETEELMLSGIPKHLLSADPQTSIAGASTPGGAAGYTPRALPPEEEAALLAADEKQFTDQQQAAIGVQVPPSPPGGCSPTLMRKFAGFFERKEHGLNMNAMIKGRRDFNNPSLYETLVDTFGIDEKGTNFSSEVFDPRAFRPEDFYTALGDHQTTQELKRKRHQKKE